MLGENQMAKAIKQEVEVTAPKITSAWNSAIEFINKSENEAVPYLLKIVDEINKMKISVNDMEKVIKKTGTESDILKFSHARALTTWANLRRFSEFVALPLSKQLSQANTSYKKLTAEGVAKEKKFSEVIKKTKAKTQQANNKQNTPKEPKSPKSTLEKLEQIKAYILSLNLAELQDAEIDALNDIADSILQNA
jgi:hypothetical protein